MLHATPLRLTGPAAALEGASSAGPLLRAAGPAAPGRGAGALVAPLAVVPFAAAALRARRRRGHAAAVTRCRASKPYPQGVYDPEAAAEYYASRPFPVVARAWELASNTLSLGANLLLDRQFGNLESNADQRADELTRTLTRLGPTFIKIGQALSIRADLLSPPYLRALTELQDQVPPFPTEQADEIIERELGQPVGELFETITPKPIASASLGQVYRATRREDGKEVAVKVQRPDVEEIVALDLFLLKVGAGPLQFVLSVGSTGLNTDLVGLVDAWGEGFVGELDYRQEAENAREFNEAIAKTPLGSTVFAPQVVQECSSKKVLTSEWILGERLELSTSGDVTKLCSVATDLAGRE